jgi:predicted amidohydrolase YtcJ
VVSEAPDALVLRRVEVDGRLVDVAIVGGVVQAVAPELPVPAGADVVDGAGGALLPGLHDHHVHLHAMAARLAGLDLDPFTDARAVDVALRRAAGERGSESTGGTWVRASGYDEHRHGPMDRARLDAVGGDRCAIRVQHRTGLSWVLSSQALAEVGLLDARGQESGSADRPPGVELDEDGRPTGWLHRMDAWLAVQLPARTEVDLTAVGKTLVGYGITGVTDATFAIGADRLASLRSAATAGALPQRLVLLGADDPSEVEGWARLGPAKLLADEVVGVDVDGLAVAVARWHESGRPVAVHAVTRAECVAAVSALAAAGPRRGDRIEHGSVLPRELDPVLRDGGITVVVQPSLVAERGDHHLVAVDGEDLPILHRHASLLAAGVRVGVGSDAPVTSADPWRGIAAASRRTTRGGAVVGASEAVDPATALGWYLADPADPGGPPRRIEPGRPADLCLLRVPLAEALAHPSVEHVRSTWVGATLVHG